MRIIKLDSDTMVMREWYPHQTLSAILLIAAPLLWFYFMISFDVNSHTPYSHNSNSPVVAIIFGLILLIASEVVTVRIDRGVRTVTRSSWKLLGRNKLRVFTFEQIERVSLHKPYSSAQDPDTEEEFFRAPLCIVTKKNSSIAMSLTNGLAQYFYDRRLAHYRNLGNAVANFIGVPFKEN